MTESRGLRRSRPEGELAALLERAASLWAQGLPMSAMAARLGCTRSSLGGLISRHRRQGGTLFPPRAASNRARRLEAGRAVEAEARRGGRRRRGCAQEPARKPAGGKVGCRGCHGAPGRRKPSWRLERWSGADRGRRR